MGEFSEGHPEENIPIELPPRKDEAVVAEKMKRVNFDNLKEQIKTGALRDEAGNIGRLLIEIEDEIPQYDTIFSDETHGRIPTLIFRKIIARKRQELGLDSPNTYFLEWGRSRLDDPEVKAKMVEFIAKKKSEINKVLVITEYIHSGTSLNTWLQLLEQQGINYDTGSVTISRHFADEGFRDKEAVTGKLKYGHARYDNEDPPLNHIPDYQVGVLKTGTGPHPYRYDPEYWNRLSWEKKDTVGKRQAEAEIQKEKDKLKEIARDIDILAEELYKLLD